MMKNSMLKWLLAVVVLIQLTSLSAQIYDPVKWSFSSKAVSNGEYELLLTATIQDNWHLYSQNLPSEDGPIPTTFRFEPSAAYELVGKTTEPKAKTEYDPNFDMELSYFSKRVDFKQRIKLNGKPTIVKGELEYMVCDDKMCLPPELISFEIEVKPTENLATENQKEKIEEPQQETLDADQTTATEQSTLLEPVKWTVKWGSNDTVEVIAEIEQKWHMYSINLPEDDGPLPTEIEFDNSSEFERIGDLVVVGEELKAYDANFMMDLLFYEHKVIFKQKVKPLKSNARITGYTYYMACDDEKCITPIREEFELVYTGELAAVANNQPQDERSETGSLLAIFIAGFLGGLLALLTPCVFPMIPLTVSFFTKQSKTRAKGISNALLYGASIIVIYVLLGFGITVSFGPDALNALSTNFWFNLAFFVLFVVFAISFFGAFEITLPSSWVNKADAASDKGGLIGIFFMAFTLSLVSFSCTGPIIGTLLVEAAVNGGVQGPLVGMFGFSSALALPFALFAAFPGWLNSLPKSGGWLNSVKVVLGFLELALALKFLSNADLVIQAGWITREIFLAIWIGIFGMMTVYLLGFITLPHDSEVKRLGVGRMLVALVTFIFTIYLIPGLWGAPLKLISGFPPPMFYSESPDGVGKASTVNVNSAGGVHSPSKSHAAHCPHNLNCFHDYEEGLAYAKEVNKPVMLDFTGWACVNCRKMEEQVWSDPQVLSLLQNEVVLISLYVDEKTELPKEEQIEVQIGDKTKTLKTVGNKWSYFQATKYKTNSQPHYVILDHNENQLHESAAYDPDIPKFIDWLERGIALFEKAK